MEQLSDIARVTFSSLLFALTAIVAYQLLTGRINLKGLLEDKTSEDLSPGRVQLLFVMLLTAFFCAKTGLTGERDGLQILSPEMLALIGGSQGLYLFDKHRSCRHREEIQ